MNIVILTSTENRHAYVASKIASHFPEDDISVILEPKDSKNIKKSRFQRFLNSKNKISFINRYLINLIFYKSLKSVAKEKKDAEELYFNDINKQKLASLKLKVLEKVEHGYNVNDNNYVEIIESLCPDIIVVMGTSLIKENIIKIPKLGILNIHTGLSPFYRGGMTNFWPFIYKELGFCGVTVHKLDIGIDSGDIIYHGLPNIVMGDTFSSINCKSIKLGTSLMIDAIKDLKNNDLNSTKQWKDGDCKLFFNQDFNGYYAYKYIKSYKDVLRDFLETKSFPEKLFLRDIDDK